MEQHRQYVDLEETANNALQLQADQRGPSAIGSLANWSRANSS